MARRKRNEDGFAAAQAHLGSGGNGQANGAEDATAGHNSAIRAEKIRDVCKRLAALNQERDAISEDIRGLKSEVIKGQLGLKISDFNIAFRLYELENNDRDELLDTLRETFNALGVGEQLDWLDQAHGKKPIPAAVAVHDPGPAHA